MENQAKCVQDKETYLYRHYDEEGRLLYVGISLAPYLRLKGHLGSSFWAKEIKTVRVEYHQNRRSALNAEKEAIEKESPLYNVAYITGSKGDYLFDEAVVLTDGSEFRHSFDGIRNFGKLDGIQAEAIKRELEMCQGNVALTARRLGLSRQGLHNKMKKLSINAAPMKRKFKYSVFD